MIFDFDPAKDEANRRKHGVPLSFGIRVFEDGDPVVLASLRPVEGKTGTRRWEVWVDGYGPPSMSGAGRSYA
jgi:uncharacterized DUF497 family protein